MLIGVAGHVDHGKTALVEALTGINADRLPEERRRGMTIDLGFAYAPAGNGHVLDLVDLPGHERFLHNFLAGALALDRILLVVAADEGIAVQTVEHLAILDRIGIDGLTVALTKADRVDEARLSEVTTGVGQLLRATRFEQAPVLPVSSRTGFGIEALRLALETAPERADGDDGRRFRMPIDRAFQAPGAGLVVTGSVVSGQVSVGDHLILSPTGQRVRVRSLQANNRDQLAAGRGQRCGVGLGGVDPSVVRRGEWLLDPALHAPTQSVVALMRTIGAAPWRDGRFIQAHVSAAAAPARAFALGPPSHDAAFPVHLTFLRPIVALHGDRLVLREPGRGVNLAAGQVVDPFARPRRALRKHAPAAIVAMGSAAPERAIEAVLAHEGAIEIGKFALSRNLPAPRVRAAAQSICTGYGGEGVALADWRARELGERVLALLAEAHRLQPNRPGLETRALVRRLVADADAATGAEVLARLARDGAVVLSRGLAHLPDHQPRLPTEDEALWSRLQPILAAALRRPPTVAQLAGDLSLDRTGLLAALLRLEHFGRVVMLAPNRAFLPEGVDQLVAVASSLGTSSSGLFTVAEFNQSAGVGRNLSVQLLEFMDRTGRTERLGDRRRCVQARDLLAEG